MYVCVSVLYWSWFGYKRTGEEKKIEMMGNGGLLVLSFIFEK